MCFQQVFGWKFRATNIAHKNWERARLMNFVWGFTLKYFVALSEKRISFKTIYSELLCMRPESMNIILINYWVKFSTI